jgi:hypothetical protein
VSNEQNRQPGEPPPPEDLGDLGGVLGSGSMGGHGQAMAIVPGPLACIPQGTVHPLSPDRVFFYFLLELLLIFFCGLFSRLVVNSSPLQ